jgi:hypothetical protein
VDTRADERGVTVITGDMEVFSADIIVDFDSIWEEFSQGEFASYWGIAQTTGRGFIAEKGITCLTAAGRWWAVLKIPPPVTASYPRALEIWRSSDRARKNQRWCWRVLHGNGQRREHYSWVAELGRLVPHHGTGRKLIFSYHRCRISRLLSP